MFMLIYTCRFSLPPPLSLSPASSPPPPVSVVDPYAAGGSLQIGVKRTYQEMAVSDEDYLDNNHCHVFVFIYVLMCTCMLHVCIHLFCVCAMFTYVHLFCTHTCILFVVRCMCIFVCVCTFCICVCAVCVCVG